MTKWLNYEIIKRLNYKIFYWLNDQLMDNLNLE